MKRFFTAALVLSTLAAPPALGRTWTDVTGKFAIEAELVEAKDGKVRLRKTDGTVIVVRLEKLSPADQRYVKERGAIAPGGDAATLPASELTGKPRELATDDGKSAGKKSFPKGHATLFDAPEGTWYLTAIRIHGARYGHRTPPREDFHITLCDERFNKIAGFRFRYKLFARGNPKWVTLKVRPTKVPPKFLLCADFHADRTKGVFVSHDALGKSLVGLPGRAAGRFTGGDWLIRAKIDCHK